MAAFIATNASQQATKCVVAKKFVITFNVEAEPKGPVCKTFFPRTHKIGLILSNIGRSQPANIAILPVFARWHPPETGQSAESIPFSRNLSANLITSEDWVVLISIHIFPLVAASSIPLGP